MFDRYLCKRFSGKHITVGEIIKCVLDKDPFIIGMGYISGCMWVSVCVVGTLLPTWAIIFAPVVGVVFGCFMYAVGFTIAQIIQYFLSIKIAECPLKKEKQ